MKRKKYQVNKEKFPKMKLPTSRLKIMFLNGWHFFQIIFDNFVYPVANHLEKARQMFLNNPNQGYTVYLFYSKNDSLYFFEKHFFPEVMYVCEERKHFFRVLFAEMGENKRYFGLKKKSFPIDVQCFIFFFFSRP